MCVCVCGMCMHMCTCMHTYTFTCKNVLICVCVHVHPYVHYKDFKNTSMHGATKLLAWTALATSSHHCTMALHAICNNNATALKMILNHVSAHLEWHEAQPSAIPCPCPTATHILCPHIIALTILWACGAQKRQRVCWLCHRSDIDVVHGCHRRWRLLPTAAYLHEMVAVNHI